MDVEEHLHDTHNFLSTAQVLRKKAVAELGHTGTAVPFQTKALTLAVSCGPSFPWHFDLLLYMNDLASESRCIITGLGLCLENSTDIEESG